MSASVVVARIRKPLPAIVAAPVEARLDAIARSEFRFLTYFAFAVCVVTSIPYLVGRVSSRPGMVFTDVLTHSIDSKNYLAYVQQAADGAWLFRNPMTPEQHKAVFFNLEWLVAGKISRLFRISGPAAMNVERIACLALMCFAVYWLAAHLFRSRFVRRIALVAIVAGGGFGWITAVHILHIPIDSSYFLDLSNANLFPFYWALKVPHFLVSESFVALGLASFLYAEANGRIRSYAFAGLTYVAAGTCRPYDMLYAMAATFLFVIFSSWKRKDHHSRSIVRLLPILICAPVLAYYFWIFKLHPVFRWWSNAGNTAASPWLLALSFGPSFLFFAYSLSKLRAKLLTPASEFMICCLVTAIGFTYSHHWLHFAFQFATNLLVPIVLITLFALEDAIIRWQRRSLWAGIVVTIILFVNSFTSLALTAQAALLVKNGDFREDAGLLDSYSWLSAHSHAGDIVLADFDNSTQIPDYTHNVVFCGYGNSVDFDQKLNSLHQFLTAGTANEFRWQLLSQYQVRFVLLTPEEAHNVAGVDPPLFLQEWYRNNSAVIYSVSGGGMKSTLAGRQSNVESR